MFGGKKNWKKGGKSARPKFGSAVQLTSNSNGGGVGGGGRGGEGTFLQSTVKPVSWMEGGKGGGQ